MIVYLFPQRPDGTYICPMITDNGDGTYNVTYTPEDLGVYDIKVKYAGKDVPGSPFNVKATPTGDASKCKITGTQHIYLQKMMIMMIMLEMTIITVK